MRNDGKDGNAPRRMRGFIAASSLVRAPVRKAAEGRGFAVAKLLTHWDEVAGPDLAPLCRPERITYGKGGLGATLRLLASGAAAPLVQMQLSALKERINALYGYSAIARITLTQSSATGGLAEAQSPFAHRSQGANIVPPSPERLEQLRRIAHGITEDVGDPNLRSALDQLAAQVLSRSRKPQ